MSGLDKLKGSLSALADIYAKTHNGQKADADQLMKYANQKSSKYSLFDVWDQLLSNGQSGHKKGSSVSSGRFYANGNSLLFQTEDTNEIVAFDLKTGKIEIATNKDLASLLDDLDGGEVGSIDEQVVVDSKMKLGKDTISLFGSVRLLNTEVVTEDKSNQGLTISRQDVKNLLKTMAENLNFDGIEDLIKSVKANPEKASGLKDVVKDFILSRFGGNIDNVLKNLIDNDGIATTQLGYLNSIRENVFNEMIDKVYQQITGAYLDKQVYKNNDIEFNIDEISAVKLSFSEEVKEILTADKIDVHSQEFLNYLNNLDGDPDIDVTAEDEVKIESDGTVSVKGNRVDKSTKSADGANGEFSISSADVQNILNEIKAGKDPKQAVTSYLQGLFGEDPTAALGKMLDEKFSESGAGYLNQAREDAYNQVVAVILSKIQSAFIDNQAQQIKEMNIDVDVLNGVKFQKSDFKDINFAQKATQCDLDKPEFIQYVNDMFGKTDIKKENISIDADGNINISILSADNTSSIDPKTKIMKANTDNFEELAKKLGVDVKEVNALNEIKAGLKDNTVYIAKGSQDGKYHIYSKFIGTTKAGGKNIPYGQGSPFVSIVPTVSGNNNLYGFEDYKESQQTSTTTEVKEKQSKDHINLTVTNSSTKTTVSTKSSFSTGSPLILDTDHDGKVEAQQGIGVDVDGNGLADGAAVGGDKMLAMGDLDGDGIITGKEVFGDQTIDPFTGKKLNAANGFEALRIVAESAEKHTGIKCIVNEEIDLAKLKQVLEANGKGSLGLISGDNVTKLEELGNIAKINVSSYQSQEENGDVQHRQLGTYTDSDGNEYEVDDVWFKLA